MSLAALPTGRQGQLLLAYLVCHRTRACPRYELEDVLWPERAPAASDSALSSLLSKLRRALRDFCDRLHSSRIQQFMLSEAKHLRCTCAGAAIRPPTRRCTRDPSLRSG